MSTSSVPAGKLSAGIVLAILLVAANLRATLTGVGALLPMIEQDTGLSTTTGGLLSALPLLALAITSPFVGRVAARWGSAPTLTAALGLLAVGTIVRSLPTLPALFAGTVLLAVAIAFGNVMLPAVIRESVPTRLIPTISSLYVATMSSIAAVSSGISVPLAHALPGAWRTSLAWGLVLTVVALAFMLPRAWRAARPAARPRSTEKSPWRSWLAWQVSFFMGLQSLMFYALVAWLPTILGNNGYTPTAAGWVLFLYQVVAILASLVLPVIARTARAQQVAAGATGVIAVTGLVLLITAPSLAILAAALCGLGNGAAVTLALSFQSQRAASPAHAASLAGMAQSIGYLVAAAGPLLLGALHDATGSWIAPLTLLAALCAMMGASGVGAGRGRFVGQTQAITIARRGR